MTQPPNQEDAELVTYIRKRLESTQTNFDLTKATMITAGLFVAAGITLPSLHATLIFHHTGIKVVLALTTLSALTLVLSFVFAEHQTKRHDRLTGPKPFKRAEKLILGKMTPNKAKFLAWYYVKFHDQLITVSNNLSTLLLLLALSAYLYILIK
jgi:hypothetical protein